MQMRLVQFEIPGKGRRVGVVDEPGPEIHPSDIIVGDLTNAFPELIRIAVIFEQAQAEQRSLENFLLRCIKRIDIKATLPYGALLNAEFGGSEPFLHPPLDHPDPHRVLISGTGLTHLGSMKSRDNMHAEQEKKSDQPLTDSAKMFQMGLDGGIPEPGKRGVAPEWFYKGNGYNLRGPNTLLEIPDFTTDGGEEPEIVGCYIIDANGQPRRLGFALGNEWSDHATEKQNYLYLAPSKLRTCAVGPELVIGHDFQSIKLSCKVERNGEAIYDSGELFTGEQHMCHSLANCEDHHFKYPLHRQPGDIHLHYFGTSKLSFGHRDWTYQQGDVVTVEAPGFSGPLVNTVERIAQKETPMKVSPA